MSLRRTLKIYLDKALRSDLFLNEEKYAERCTKRMQSVRAYISSNTFYSDICVGALSAIPRWKFAQKLESRGDEGCSKRLTKALTAFYEETRAITLSKNVLVEHVVNRDPMGNTLRMLIYGAMIRAYVYLVEKNDRVFAGSLYSLSSHFLSTHFGFYSLW